MTRVWTLLLAAVMTLGLGACATTGGETPQEKRKSVQAMREATLQQLYKIKPDTKAQIAAAPGYAVFSSANVNLILASFAGGYGVAVDNKTGKQTYMKMGEVGLGLGAGIKDYRAVFVFHTRERLDNFINSGWEFGGSADAAAKAGEKGGAVAGEVLLEGVTVYQLTESGLALQVTLKGTKYWQDDDLNN